MRKWKLSVTTSSSTCVNTKMITLGTTIFRGLVAVGIVLTSVTILAMPAKEEISLAAFKAAEITEPTVFRVKLRVTSNRHAYNDLLKTCSGASLNIMDKFLAVEVSPIDRHNNRPQSNKNFFCFVTRKSEAGRSLENELNDGDWHVVLASLRYSRNPKFKKCCTIDKIEIPEAKDSSLPHALPTSSSPSNSLNEVTEDPDVSKDDLLLRQFNRNLIEIKNLCKKNPACYINPKPKTFTNLSKRMATSKDRLYSTATNITLVRETFFCSTCKMERSVNYKTPCCRTSRQVSFNNWREARKMVDVTEEINNRIDELRSENEALEQKIRTIRK